MPGTITKTEPAQPVLPEGQLVYSVATLANAIDRSPQFVRNAIGDNKLSAKRNGRAIFIFPEEAVRWLSSMDDA